MPSQPSNVKEIKRSGKDGEAGENCGKIMIHNSLTVYAYGGAGGSGGIYTAKTGSSGTGGGGYPGAGIGRWSVLGQVVLTIVMVAEAIVVGLTRCRLKKINLWIGIWEDMSEKGVFLASGAPYYTSNYKTLKDGTELEDIAYKQTVGGRRTVLVEWFVNYIGKIREEMEELLDKVEK